MFSLFKQELNEIHACLKIIQNYNKIEAGQFSLFLLSSFESSVFFKDAKGYNMNIPKEYTEWTNICLCMTICRIVHTFIFSQHFVLVRTRVYPRYTGSKMFRGHQVIARYLKGGTTTENQAIIHPWREHETWAQDWSRELWEEVYATVSFESKWTYSRWLFMLAQQRYQYYSGITSV